MAKHALSDMTFLEFRERLARAPAPVILLPFGSQEEQGPHAPMGDFRLTERLALMAAQKADAIAAPTVPFGHAEFFRAIAGGIQLSAPTFTAIVEEMIGAFLDHGIDRLIIFNGHTTNASLIDAAVRRVRLSRGVTVPFINVWRCIPSSLWAQIYGADAAKARGHGGDPITSVNMHLFPDLLRPDMIRQKQPRTAFGLPVEGTLNVTFEGLPVQMPVTVTEVDANGMIGGDATLASADKGRVICDHIVGFTARFVEHWRSVDPRDPNSALAKSPQ
jgi:creatinine amidohydrolase